MRRAVLFGGLYVIIVFFAAQILTKPSSALTPSIWGSTFNIAGNEIVAPTDRNTAECSFATMRLRLFTAGTSNSANDVSFLSSKETASTPKDLCTVTNSHGTFSGALGYWAPENNLEDVLQIENATIIPVPSSNTVLITNVFGSDPGGYRVGVNYNFPAIGHLEAGYTGPTNNRVKYKKWQITTSAPHMQFSNNAAMTFKSWAFSENGKYAAAMLFSGMLIRVDLQSQEVQPVAQLSSLKSNWQLGISNDGKYALSYQSESSALNFHDLTGCQIAYAKNTLPSTGANTAGCMTTNLQNKISSLYPSTVLALMNNFKFGSNGSSFSVDTLWRTTPSEITKRRIEFRAANYVPQNEGYLALGDSFSSGEGDLEGGIWYEPGTDEQGNKDTFEGRNLCHLSRRSYPYLIAKQLGYLPVDSSTPVTPSDTGLFHSVACSGAVIHNVIGGSKNKLINGAGDEENFANSDNQYSNIFLSMLGRWQPGRIKQLDRLDSTVFGGYTALETFPEVITIGISGNDAGFGDTIKACTMPGTCKQAVAGSVDSSNLAIRLMKLKPKLVDTYRNIIRASPDSRVYVHGYPLFVTGAGNCGLNVLLNSQETQLVEEGVKYMNQIVRAAALEAGVFYVDVEDILNGVNLCSGAVDGEMAVNGVTAGNDIDFKLCIFRTGCLGSESFHPNQIAHKRYKTRLLGATDNLNNLMPMAQNQNTPVPSSFFGVAADSAAKTINNGINYSVIIPEPKSFLQSTEQGLQIVQSGLLPGTVIKVELQSTPMAIAEFTVPANGEVNQAITLPPTAEPGAHELHIFGTTNTGVAIDYYEPLAVSVSETDFDGDGVLNSVDSCPVTINSFVDVDDDSVDDACDSYAVIPPPAQPPIVEIVGDNLPDPIVVLPPTEPPKEVILDETPPEQEVIVENPVEPSVPVVVNNPQVLGIATTTSSQLKNIQPEVLGTTTELAETGQTVLVKLIISGLLILTVAVLSKLQVQD